MMEVKGSLVPRYRSTTVTVARIEDHELSGTLLYSHSLFPPRLVVIVFPSRRPTHPFA